MRIMGLASSMSLVKDDPYAAVNRRISLVVLNERTQRRIEEENAAAAGVTPMSSEEIIQAARGQAAPSGAPAAASAAAPAGQTQVAGAGS